MLFPLGGLTIAFNERSPCRRPTPARPSVPL